MASAQINYVRIDHNLWEGNSNGMVIHVGFNVQGLVGQRGRVSVYFNYWQGGPLDAFESPYRTEDGHVSVGNDFVPQFEDTNYPDDQLFMPYAALKMAAGGTSALMCRAIIWDESSPVPQALANSAWYQFMYTS
jgi:hypothetical protein